jgi:hypothetical protein
VAEDYVRPPILAIEPPSRRAAVWRFRAVMALIVVILAAGLVLAIRAITGGGEGGATVGGLAVPVARAATAATAATAASPAGR